MPMKPAVLLFAALAAGVVGAVIGGNLGSPATTDQSNEAVHEIAAITDRMEQLLEGQEVLADRLSRLEARPMASSNPRRAPVAPPETPAMPAELERLAASLSDETAPLPANFTARVGEAMEEVRELERQEEAARREERNEERMERRLVELQESLGLSNGQVLSLGNVLRDDRTARTELFTEIRESGDWGSMREASQALREDRNAALAGVLTPSQLEQYKETEESNDRGWGGGRGGGRGGSGGRGGF